MATMVKDEIDEAGYEKSCLLVGKYLSAWSVMEGRIDDGIRRGLNLNVLQNSIVCANVGFTAKCHILQTLAMLGKKKVKGKRDENEKLFEKLKNLSADRNMIAHCQFFPTKNKKGQFCVEFFVVKAKGNFGLPKVVWPETVFNKNMAELYVLRDEIVKVSKTLSYRLLADTLMKSSNQTPNIMQLGQGLLSRPSLQPLVGLLSGNYASSQKTTPQTPPGDEG